MCVIDFSLAVVHSSSKPSAELGDMYAKQITLNQATHARNYRLGQYVNDASRSRAISAQLSSDWADTYVLKHQTSVLHATAEPTRLTCTPRVLGCFNGTLLIKLAS